MIGWVNHDVANEHNYEPIQVITKHLVQQVPCSSSLEKTKVH